MLEVSQVLELQRYLRYRYLQSLYIGDCLVYKKFIVKMGFKYHIGIFHIWINSLRKAHPQDVVVALQVSWLGKKEYLLQDTHAS